MSTRMAEFGGGGGSRGGVRRGFTLIEVVIVIVVLALAIPPTVFWLDQAAGRRADAAQVALSNTLATAVLENVMADCASTSTGLGFDALANASYLTGPTGLPTRMAATLAPYSARGITVSVTIGALSDKDGVVSGTATDNVFRRVTVTPTFTDSLGNVVTIPVTTVVTKY